MSCYTQCDCLVPVGVTKTNNRGLSEKELEVINRVLARGGGKNAELLVTLEWFSIADLDLHVLEPNDSIVGYKNKNSANGGILDVDANVGSHDDEIGEEVGLITDPVENISYTELSKMQNGMYSVCVNSFKPRLYSDHNYTNHFNIYIFVKKQKDTQFTKVAKLTSKVSLKTQTAWDDPPYGKDRSSWIKIVVFNKTDDNITLQSIDDTYVNVELLHGIDFINRSHV